MPTAAADPAEEAFAQLGMEVPLAQVDKELKKLWEADNAKTRASLINFAIYSEEVANLGRNNALLDGITAQHACRALMILSRPTDGEPRARAWINALCRPYHGQQTVCCEQLSFLLDGGGAAQVQNIVFAHLDSDLPLVVWWQGTLTRNFEERLSSRIATLIVDSATWANPCAEIDVLIDARERSGGKLDIRDLSWTRSHFVRLALAACFQDPIACASLPRIEEIAIRHAKGHRVAALLLGAWVAQRLGGQLDDRLPGFQFQRAAGGPNISVTLEEVPSGNALQSLSLKGKDMSAVISRDADSPYVHVCGSCGDHRQDEIFPADVETETELISEQLSRAGGTTLYSTMLPALRKMVGRAGCD
ncbi:MAG: glucose-6-phosphate dehydrogenase assembly protein OpcA [Verrucomicrobiales bacterium]|nr:glucose-6-phosphate dehydrogenase assembly protein OpcA [Verrucomicrobiales bacterium]MCP5559684.1 glucose-6-phosphate dehydrogenase assembly protein OpcA [Verrucomicrobiaceae bacterium]